MIKSIIRSLINLLGYDIIRLENQISKKYQIPSDQKDEFLFKTKIGTYYTPKFLKSDVISVSISKGEVFDKNIIEVIKEYLHEGDCFLDIGANYGQMSVHISKIVGNSGKNIHSKQNLMYSIS
jgi:hypothetical protein